jgi:hypothetical protein
MITLPPYMKSFLLVSLGVEIGIIGIGLLVDHGLIVPRMSVSHQPQLSEKRLNAIHCVELLNNTRWGTFVEASDTLYIEGDLMIFDTVNLVYRKVATATIHPVK